jgi:hypothetical protein
VIEMSETVRSGERHLVSDGTEAVGAIAVAGAVTEPGQASVFSATATEIGAIGAITLGKAHHGQDNKVYSRYTKGARVIPDVTFDA